MVRRKYGVPRHRKEWGSLVSDMFSLAAGVFLLFILQKNYQAPMEAVMQYKGKSLPSFRFVNLKSGQEDMIEKYKDSIVILNIWATWCPPCRREMPELDKLQREFRGKMVVLALSDETAPAVLDYNSKHPFSFSTGVFTKTNELIQRINTRPVSILLMKGKVKDIVIGSRGYGFFREWIE